MSYKDKIITIYWNKVNNETTSKQVLTSVPEKITSVIGF